MQPSHGRYVSVIVDARKQRHGRFDPTGEGRDDARNLGRAGCGVQPELLKDEGIDRIGHSRTVAERRRFDMTGPSSHR